MGTFDGNVVANPHNGSITFEEYGSCSEYSDFKNGMDSTSEVSNKTWNYFTFTWGKCTNELQQSPLKK